PLDCLLHTLEEDPDCPRLPCPHRPLGGTDDRGLGADATQGAAYGLPLLRYYHLEPRLAERRAFRPNHRRDGEGLPPADETVQYPGELGVFQSWTVGLPILFMLSFEMGS